MGITQKQLEQAYSDHASRFAGHKNDYFAPLYLINEFGGRFEDYQYKVAFGGNDYGLDAYHFDFERRNLHLYQFKWTESHAQFKGSMERLCEAGIERVFGDPTQDSNQNQFVLHLKKTLDENQAIIDRVYINFVFNGDPEAAEKSKVLDALREDIEAKRFWIDQFFGAPATRQIGLTIQFLSNETKKLGMVVKQKKAHIYSFPIDNVLETRVDKGAMFVGFIPLMALHQMFKGMGPRLFNRNIRMGLGGDRPTNRAIKASLKSIIDGETSPALFALDHNGFTISAEQFRADAGQASIVEPRVLNGAQTVTTLEAFLESQDGNNGALAPLDDIRVLARIIVTGSSDLITRVTINNNRQNPVEPWHLRASDKLQLEFEDRFKEDLQLFYGRQEKAFESLSDSELEEMGYELSNKAIEIRRLAQTFLAVQGELDRMSRLTEVFDAQKQYEECFRTAYLKADLRKVVLCYKIQFRIKRMLEEIREKGGTKYGFVDKARNLTWALLAQGLLNDEDLGEFAEDWGKDLTFDANFGDELKRIASTRVRLIYSELLKDEHIVEQIEEERYGFLRTKSIFQQCMDIAYKKWDWLKKSF